MTPREFIEKWRDNPLKERASYQLHFIDLCALLSVPTPSPSSHETYCFERGAARTGAEQGWADVWKKGFFGFEYKAARRNLGKALKQLMTYALALDNPPLLVVCDTNIIEIHTHFTNAPSEVHTIALKELALPANLDKLRWWRHGEPRIAMRAALKGLPRYIATPHVSKHRMFIWLDASVLPDKMLIVIARSDDTTFETFPFPEGLAPADTASPVRPEPVEGPVHETGGSTSSPRTGVGAEIAAAAQKLNQLRDNWLNPPEWADWVRSPEEEKAGYPSHPIAKVGRDSSRLVGLKSDLQKRTLTNLCNARPPGWTTPTRRWMPPSPGLRLERLHANPHG